MTEGGDKKCVGKLPHKTSSRIDVAFVIDLQNTLHLDSRLKTLETVKNACSALNANFHHVQYEKLDNGDENIVETMYNADLALIDLSIAAQRSSLFYHVGVRESFGMKQNILMANELEMKDFKLPSSNLPVLKYRVDKDGSCHVSGADTTLEHDIKGLLQNAQFQTKVHMKEKFLSDLLETHEALKGAQLSGALLAMRDRLLRDPNLQCREVVGKLLDAFRDVQSYDEVIDLVEKLELDSTDEESTHTRITYVYAFCVNRRNKAGDREKSLKIILDALSKVGNAHPDLNCLAGRTFKDKFTESNYSDRDSLDQAVTWYRRGFELQPNQYAGINLATLLVVSGRDWSNCEELQYIGMVLNNLIGKKGSLQSLSYWDVATYFEINVLAKNYCKAIVAAELMFKLQPPSWYLQSTMGNINLIKRFVKDDDDKAEKVVFEFWTAFFNHAGNSEVVVGADGIPILIMKSSRTFVPSFVTLDEEQKLMMISNICLKCLRSSHVCNETHEWIITADLVKSVSLYKRDDRCAFLYVHMDPDDFQIYFPTTHFREHFYEFAFMMQNPHA